jgi:uncharacterized protein YkwD
MVKIGIIILLVLIVGVVGFLYVNNVIEINQNNLEETIQNIPRDIKDTTKTATDLATVTSDKIQETMTEHIDTIQKIPDVIPVKEISEIPKKIQESNPLRPVIDKAELERQIHLLTNQHRTENGLKPLTWDDKLSSIAKNHSRDMALQNYFDHISPDGLDPTDRGSMIGYKCEKMVGNLFYSGIAENIFQNNLYDTVWYVGDIPTVYEWNTLDDIANSTVSGWMESADHKKNLLSEIYARQGIGVEISSDDKVYITQDFC